MINNKYIIDDYIGSGGFGKVYRARDITDNKMKALKFNTINEITDKEAQILENFSHKHIVTFYEYFTYDTTEVCIVTEYCEDGDLKNYILNLTEKLPNDRLIRWFRQLLSGLRYMHSQHIMHRDIKPNNIFLTENQTKLKYGDFGLSKETSSSNQNVINSRKGTFNYAAPEVFLKSDYTDSVDVWSLGCVFYEMITLKQAFEKQKILDVIQTKNEDLIPKLENDHFLSILLSNMLVFDKNNRKKASELLNIVIEIQKKIENVDTDKVNPLFDSVESELTVL